MSLPADYTSIPAINWSTLKHLRESPLHYRHALTAPSKETDAMRIGTATHLAVLEPERFAERVAVWDGERRAGNAYKEWLAANEGKLHLRTQDLAGIDAIATAVRAHPVAARLLSEGEAEVTLEWTDEATGLRCKGRADWIRREEDGSITVIDLKTTRTTNPRQFAAQCAQLGYHGQAAHYVAGVRAMHPDAPTVRFIVIAVESGPPHDVAVYELDAGVPDGALYVGELLRRELLTKLADCIRHDEWPGRCPRMETLCLPGWALTGSEIEDFTFETEED